MSYLGRGKVMTC